MNAKKSGLSSENLLAEVIMHALQPKTRDRAKPTRPNATSPRPSLNVPSISLLLPAAQKIHSPAHNNVYAGGLNNQFGCLRRHATFRQARPPTRNKPTFLWPCARRSL